MTTDISFFTAKAENRTFDEVCSFLKTVRELYFPFGTKPLRKVQVAGTNGKGSVSCMLASVLTQAGYKTGLNISPSLLRVNERIKLNGTDIPDEALCSYIPALQKAEQLCGRSFGGFDRITAASELYFIDEGVDIAVMETGLGGRFDTVTAVPELILAIICNIALDHQKMLGTTLSDMAFEKCGILRDNVPCVIHPQLPETNVVTEQTAAKKHVNLIRVSDCKYELEAIDGENQLLRVQVGDASYELTIPLLGEHQQRNAVSVLLAALELRKQGFDIPDKSIISGIACAKWPGRMQHIRIDGINAPIILDGAHNPDAMQTLRKALSCIYPDKKFYAVVSIMADKDIPGIASELAQFTENAVCLKVNQRAEDETVLSHMLFEAGINASTADDAYNALKLADKSAPDIIIACGSLYLVSAMLELYKNQSKDRKN